MIQKIFFFLLLITTSISNAQNLVIPLNSNWQFRQSGNNDWYPAEVPGTVHTDLLSHKLIDDPYFGIKESALQWIEKEDWEYKMTFQVDAELLTKDKIFLDFQGLDTYADVFLNDSLVLEANNMFRSWKVDVEGKLRKGDNQLKIFFHSPIKKTELMYDNLVYTIPVGLNDQEEKKLSVFTRKATYHYGWDWGPRFVTSGIWRSIYLNAWSTATISNLLIEQRSIDQQNASLVAHLDFEVARPFVGEVEVVIDGISVKKTTVDLDHGNQKGNIYFSIENPELWWPNGLGSQKLYEVEVILNSDNLLISSEKRKIGLKTIVLIQEEDKHGSSFFLKVNGKPVFMKGTNYIPQDNFLNRVDKKRYEHLLQSAADANMNMIRVWGGGVYEDEIFYDLCDEKGLLVWQDFMFSCVMYPGDSSFLENVKVEAMENVKRLRHHPCLALWCGNNENLMKWKVWRNNSNIEGNHLQLWKNEKDSLKIVEAYKSIFKEILPGTVKSYGNGVPYWESSPAAKEGEFDNWKSGDSHDWCVWADQEPFESYRQNIGRFMSEYGFQSFPEFNTIKSFTQQQDWDINSEVMQAHQKPSTGNKTIAYYMSRNFNQPKDFENYLYASQLLQAEGVKIAMEAHRIAKPYNMGSLVWQLNDCWPVASWSSIDYFGRWKALHYYIKRAFADNIVAFEIHEDELKVYMVTDLYEDLRLTMLMELFDFGGKTLSSVEKKIKIKGNSSEEIWKGSIKELLKKARKDEVYLRAKIFDGENLITENYLLFATHKDLDLSNPNIKFDFIEKGEKLFIELNSDKTALGVCFETGDLDLLFSDNFFMLHPKETKRIEVKGEFLLNDLKNKLTVKSLIDSYNK